MFRSLCLVSRREREKERERERSHFASLPLSLGERPNADVIKPFFANYPAVSWSAGAIFEATEFQRDSNSRHSPTKRSNSKFTPRLRHVCSRVRKDIGGTDVGEDRVPLRRKTFDSVAMMRCLLMLQILIGALQANLEARQRPPNSRGESHASMYLRLVSLVRHLVRQ